FFTSLPSRVFAEVPSFGLVWEAPSTCPSEVRLRADIEQILHGPIELRPGERLVVRADVTPARDGGWHVALETDNGRRTAKRSLDAASCEELANATALLVAILIDPEAAMRNGPVAPDGPA